MTVRRRAGDAAAAFGRAGLGAAAPPAPAGPAAATATLAPATGRRADGRSKFSMLFDADGAADFDQLATRTRRMLGHRVGKSVIIRELVALAADDQSVLAQVVEGIRSRRG